MAEHDHELTYGQPPTDAWCTQHQQPATTEHPIGVNEHGTPGTEWTCAHPDHDTP